MHIYMQAPPEQDRPPRFYHVFLQQDLLGGWSLVREWGYQGAAGRIRREHHATREGAEAAMGRIRDGQLRRGYRIVFVQGEQQPG